MERWGMGYEDLRATNSEIIYLSMPMQGHDGPHRSFVGFGSTIAALSGLVWLSGRPDRTPIGTGTHYPDHVPSPGHALVALLAAIYRREVTGRGQAIEVSQFESTVNILGPAFVEHSASGAGPTRQGNRSSQASPHGVFRVAGDDRWIAIAARDDAAWASLATALGHPDWATDPRFATLADRKANEDELERLVDAATAECEPGQLVAALQAGGVPAAAVETSGGLLTDAQLEDRGFWHRLEHPVMGGIMVNRAPFRSDIDESGPRWAAPLLGQHTREIAEDVLGLSGTEIDDLIERGVFF